MTLHSNARHKGPTHEQKSLADPTNSHSNASFQWFNKASDNIRNTWTNDHKMACDE